jgi:hypothetical protein
MAAEARPLADHRYREEIMADTRPPAKEFRSRLKKGEHVLDTFIEASRTARMLLPMS